MGWVMVEEAVRIALLAVTIASLQAPALAQEAAPAEASGTVSGRIVDSSSGEPIVDAAVEPVGTGQRVRTNVDGAFSLRLPPGTYEVRVFAPLYQGMRLQGVSVKADQTSRVDAALVAVGDAGVQVVEVVAQARKATEEAQIAERKASSVVKDTISRETMRKSTGSDAAAIVRRAPSVTVRDDKFVYVRGLGERYSSARLNQSRLPSPDPFIRAVPLNLFPADFLDSIGVIKSYSPELPGDFSGGLIEIDLRDFPDKLEYSLGISGGGNTQTTGREFLTYRGAPGDYFTLGVRFRDPPRNLPPFPVTELSNRQRLSVGRSFKNIWSIQDGEAPPNMGANFSIGNRIGPFGFQLGASYLNEFRTVRNAILRQFTVGDEGLALDDDFRDSTSFMQTRVGAVLTGTYELSERQRLNIRTFIYRNAVDSTRLSVGRELGQGTPPLQRNSSLVYIVDQLSLLQMTGEHDFGWVRTDWRSALARTARHEPDSRYSTYDQTNPDRPFRFSLDGELSGERFNNEAIENLSDSALDLTVPFPIGVPLTSLWSNLQGKLKFGPAYTYRRLDFDQRDFVFEPNSLTQNLEKPLEELLAPSEIAPGLADFSEQQLEGDKFRATQEIIAGYGMLELPIVRDRLRVLAGARLEYSLIRLATTVRNGTIDDVPQCPGVPATVQFCDQSFAQRDVDPLPAVNVVYSPRNDMNFRFSWGQSVSRPEFRELVNAFFPVQAGQRITTGNPDLIESHITSWDLRWEWFFSPLELVSLSFFYKEIEDPIEKVTITGTANLTDTWANADSAELRGFEVEGRKNFGFLHERLMPLSLNANVSYIDGNVFVPPIEVFGFTPTTPTETNRQLTGQAPFIVNAALEYSDPDWLTARLVYFTAGPTITTAGSAGLPDTILERRDQIDAVILVPLARWLNAPVQLRLSAENIFNEPFLFTVGGQVQRQFTTGVKLGVGVSYAF